MKQELGNLMAEDPQQETINLLTYRINSLTTEITAARAEIATVTQQRDEALSDLKCRRFLFKLQEKQLNDVRAERDELLRYNEEFRNETLICSDCDSIRKEEYDMAIEQRDRLAEALRKLRNNESMSLGGAAYEIVEQALQSLTTNEQ